MSDRHSSLGPVDRRVRVQGEPLDGSTSKSFPKLAPGSENGDVLRITEVGESILRRRCRDAVEFGTPELAHLIDSMFITMYVAHGAGLAANQVDVDLRLFVYDCFDDDDVRHVGHILNPVVEDLAGSSPRRLIEATEGCLSIPGATETLARPEHAVVRGWDKDGRPVRLEGTGYFARCLLHETDHVDGLLYVDRLDKRRRRQALSEMERERERVFAERAARAKALGK
jgi:peptide deformylase